MTILLLASRLSAADSSAGSQLGPSPSRSPAQPSTAEMLGRRTGERHALRRLLGPVGDNRGVLEDGASAFQRFSGMPFGSSVVRFLGALRVRLATRSATDGSTRIARTWVMHLPSPFRFGRSVDSRCPAGFLPDHSSVYGVRGEREGENRRAPERGCQRGRASDERSSKEGRANGGEAQIARPPLSRGSQSSRRCTPGWIAKLSSPGQVPRGTPTPIPTCRRVASNEP
jgi:hypothetical protein